MSTGPRQVYRLQWRRASWALSTPSKSRIYGDRRPAVAAAHRLVEEGFNVSLSWARVGVWHPDSVDPPRSPILAGCEVCEGTGRFLAEIDALARPCPACFRLAS